MIDFPGSPASIELSGEAVAGAIPHRRNDQRALIGVTAFLADEQPEFRGLMNLEHRRGPNHHATDADGQPHQLLTPSDAT
jgi:hypothetical protein